MTYNVFGGTLSLSQFQLQIERSCQLQKFQLYYLLYRCEIIVLVSIFLYRVSVLFSAC